VISTDIVIVGGGIQGLVLLEELTLQGYGCLLVTNSNLGSGQTPHSHGLPNSGTRVLTGKVRERLKRALSFARARAIQSVYGTDQWTACQAEQRVALGQ
jgi:glycerol-3-phosphate dehydrogenase